ncbi:MAG: S8 family serine peptidase [Bacteriovoracia bacterium]
MKSTLAIACSVWLLAAPTSTSAAPTKPSAPPAKTNSPADASAIWLPGKQPLPKSAKIKSRKKVFTASERAFLRKIGRPDLAKAEVLQFKNEHERERVQREAPEAGLDSRAVSIEQHEQPAQPPQPANIPVWAARQQWALDNPGANFPIGVEELKTLYFPGAAGEDIGLRRAPPEGAGTKIRVAILDSGLDVTHPVLKDQIYRNEVECAMIDQLAAEIKECQKTKKADECKKLFPPRDADGNGYVADCNGYNFADTIDGNVKDIVGHGTHVAGIVASVSKYVEILPVRVISDSPNTPIRPQSTDDPKQDDPSIPNDSDYENAKGFIDRIARGVLYAIRAQAKIMNLSFAWPIQADSQFMREMIALAQSQGIQIVSSAGNDSTEARVMPCVYPGVICVGSHSPDGKISHYSNFGDGVEISAPGHYILSTFPMSKIPVVNTEGQGFEFKNGTSMASPFVAGLLARLRAGGMAGNEAFARLALGSRPQVADDFHKWTQFGNVDLPKALAEPAGPFIYPLDKRPITATFDPEKIVPVDIQVRFGSFWKDAKVVKVSARVLDGPRGAFAKLTTDTFEIRGFRQGMKADLETQMKLLPNSADHDGVDLGRVPGEAKIEWTLQADDAKPRQFRTTVDFRMAVNPKTQLPGARISPLAGNPPNKSADFRSVVNMDGSAGADYFAISKISVEKSKLTLIREDVAVKHHIVAATADIDALPGTLLTIQRVDVDQDGQPNYVFVSKLPPTEKGKAPPFKFTTFDARLAPVADYTFEHDSDKTVVSDRFQWLRTNTGGMMMVWIGLGFPPKNENAPYDPWDPEPKEPLKFRMYALGAKGKLQALSLPENHTFVEIASPTAADQAAGIVRAYTAENFDPNEEDVIFHRVDISPDVAQGLSLGTQQLVQLPRHRTLMAMNQVTAAYSLAPGDAIYGTAFTGSSIRGTQRTTVVSGNSAPMSSDGRLLPLSPIEPVAQISGVFASDTQLSVFGITGFQVIYADLARDESAGFTRRRYSFLPKFISARHFFPTVVRGVEGEKVPALWITAALGALDTLEVLVPEYGRSGELQGIASPAAFRYFAEDGCRLLGNPIPPTDTQPAQAAFYCGDHFKFMPLQR